MAVNTAPSLAQKFPPPASWKWVPDAPVAIVETLDPPEGQFLFGTMAPGWHITTHPGVRLFEPTYSARGRFAIESESFIFPGTSLEGFGVLAGGEELESSAARYTAFVIRRDGSAAVARHDAGKITLVREWTKHAAIKPHPGGNENIGNVIRVEAEADVVSFLVNGTKVLDLPRSAANVDGVIGLRIGANLNLHVTNLDITSHLALPRRKPGGK
jgi:hypothetical protein